MQYTPEQALADAAFTALSTAQYLHRLSQTVDVREDGDALNKMADSLAEVRLLLRDLRTALTKPDAEEAVQSAREAFAAWGKVTA